MVFVKLEMCALFLSIGFMSCSVEKHQLEDGQVQVMVEIPTSCQTKSNDVPDLSILVFKEENGAGTFFRREKGGWLQGVNNLEKKVLLPSGKYSFVLTGGSFDPDSDYETFREGSLKETCIFSLPVTEGNLNRACGEFFLDDNTSGQTPWGDVVDCTGNQPQTIERTLVRAVGRVDLLLCRGKKDAGGTIIPFSETSGSSGKSSYDLTLEKIKEIQITIRNTASRLCVDGFVFSDGADYTYTIGKDKNNGYICLFDVFDPEAFGNSFVDNNSVNYRRFNGFPYHEGPFLFPSAGLSEMEVIVRYDNFPERKYITHVEVKRNRVVFIIVYLLDEQLQIELDTEIIESPLNTEPAYEDGGIWH